MLSRGSKCRHCLCDLKILATHKKPMTPHMGLKDDYKDMVCLFYDGHRYYLRNPMFNHFCGYVAGSGLVDPLVLPAPGFLYPHHTGKSLEWRRYNLTYSVCIYSMHHTWLATSNTQYCRKEIKMFFCIILKNLNFFSIIIKANPFRFRCWKFWT